MRTSRHAAQRSIHALDGCRLAASRPRDKPRTTAESEVLKGPLDENDDTALKFHDVHQVNENPHQPAGQSPEVQSENIRDGGCAPDDCEAALVEIAEGRR